jgi:hypothetical protein
MAECVGDRLGQSQPRELGCCVGLSGLVLGCSSWTLCCRCTQLLIRSSACTANAPYLHSHIAWSMSHWLGQGLRSCWLHAPAHAVIWLVRWHCCELPSGLGGSFCTALQCLTCSATICRSASTSAAGVDDGIICANDTTMDYTPMTRHCVLCVPAVPVKTGAASLPASGCKTIQCQAGSNRLKWCSTLFYQPPDATAIWLTASY